MWLIIGIVLAGQPGCSKPPTGPNDSTWRLFPGHVEALSVPAFRSGQQCWVYLPPGYAVAGRRYPVLYVLDGEWIFEGRGLMHVNRICEELIRRRDIEPIIVVAIASGGTTQRFWDYTPWQYRPSPPTGGGDNFVRAIRDTLKPAIDRRFRTRADAGHTAITGFSLGGLMAAYAGYAYDGTFGRVGACSPSYHAGQMITLARDTGRPPGLLKFYQDTGYPDDNRIYPMEDVARAQGFRFGVDFMSLTVPGAIHWFDAWENRFPGMLRFLFPPE